MRRLALAGTGTGVGKTTLATRLLAAKPRTAWKPIETGGLEDARALAAVAPLHPTLHPLRDPVSPHLAARRLGVTLDLARIAADAPSDPWLLETAGGLFTPLDDEARTNLDLVRAVQATSLWLVARNRLGVLHDVLSTTRAAAAGGRAVDAVVLITFDPPGLDAAPVIDASTDSNLAELRRLVGLPVLEPEEAVRRFAEA